MAKVPTLEQERRKRRRELLVAGIAVLLIGLIIVVESRIARSAEDIPLAGHLLLFALLTVVTLLLILVIFFLIRNIFKLVFERRQKVLGSYLKTRLTVGFIALTLVPTIVLFIASAGVLHTTIESWFHTQVEDSLESSWYIAQKYYQNAADNVLDAAYRAAAAVGPESPETWDRADKLKATLRELRAKNELDAIRLMSAEGQDLLTVKAPELSTVNLPEPRASLLRIAYRGESNVGIETLEDGADLIRAVVPVRTRQEGPVKAALIAEYYMPVSLAQKYFAITNAYGDYRQAKRMRGPVQTTYVLILLMVALLVILIGSWFGMSIARDITEPIQRLADGTAQIAGGDLDVYIEPQADDELGVLVRAFNQMTADLRESRAELVKVNLDLDSRRKYMETVLKNIAAGVLAGGPDGRVTAVNTSARKLLGIEEDDIIGKDIRSVLPSESATEVAPILEELNRIESGALQRQINLQLPDRTFSLLCYANSVKDDEGRDLGAVLVFEDMSHLVKAQRMAAWRDVARRIAHEIKNPLTPIQLNAQRIRRKYGKVVEDGDMVLDQCTKAIVDQVEQLKNMVNEFSKFARMPSANPEPNDLNSLIREVVQLYDQGSRGTKFAFKSDPRVPVFDLDGEQIKRVMVNLLDNASSAAGRKGKVEVVTRFKPELSMVVVEVADNGPGIAPEDKERLFEPYFSRKPGGTGLGLTIVSTIVSDHDGFVRIKDNSNGGAIIVIELPVRRRESETGSQAP